MKYLFALLSGIILAEMVNYFLDYLPYKRKITGKKVRNMKVTGSSQNMINSIETDHLPSIDKVFGSVKFPFCANCKSHRKWGDYLLGRKCAHCSTMSSKRFWILMFVMPVAFILLTIFQVEGFRIVDLFLLFSFYTLIFVMDVEHRVIVMPLTIAGIVFGIYFGLSYHSLISTGIGALVGGGIMLLFYWFGILYIRLIRRTSNPNMYEVALGFGDVTLSFILGLILGWPGIMGGLFLGILLGGVISGLLLAVKFLTKKYAPNDLILPYAPFLVIGAFVIMLL